MIGEIYERTSLTILRIGIAFVFMYAAIAGLLHPQDYLHYFPTFLRVAIQADILTISFSVLEIVLAGWMLLGKHIFVPAVVMSLMLAAIVVTNRELMSILFRNVGLLSATLALALHDFENFRTSVARFALRKKGKNVA